MTDIIDAETGKHIGCFRYRPLATGSILRYEGVNYDLVDVLLDTDDDCIKVTKRKGTFGQYAPPDYVLDAADIVGYPRKFRVVSNSTDGNLGETLLTGQPKVGQKLDIDGKAYSVVDWSIGQRRTDEVYVK